MIQHVFNLESELLRCPEIVLIEKCEELPARSLDAVVSRRCDTLICLVYVTHIRKALRDDATVIYGTIIDNDYFKGSIRLRKDALQRSAQIGRTVVERNDATN